MFNRSLLHRHHEKLTIIDDQSIIGSSNIADEYSGSKYGENMFIDINQINQGINVHQSRNYFKKIANFYNIRIDDNYDKEKDI